MQRTQEIIEFFVFIILFLFLFFIGNLFWSSVGISLFFVFALRFFYNLGKNFDLRDLIVLLSLLQWVIGPYLAYRYYISKYETYNMLIPENAYMSFVVPATIFFAVGLFIPFKKQRYNITYTLKSISDILLKYNNIDLIFIIIGLIMSVIWGMFPSQFQFIAFLLGNLHFVGLLFLLKNKNRKNRNLYLILTLVFTFLLSLGSGMFHDLILWFGFMFLFITYIRRFSFIKKLSILFFLFFSVIVLQTVKAQFREVIWNEENISSGEKVSVFFNLVSEKIGGNFFMSQANINNLVSRINQGWIISSVMYQVPNFESYADGETIYAGLASTLIPRFIYENKASAGGEKNFERFTGHELQPGTSMNLSILGEAYANFGPDKSLLFMFLFGLFLNYSYALINKIIIKHPALLFFIPLIYLQVVKAETDFVTVLNHLVKASIFVALIFWGLKKFFNIKL